MGGKVTLEMLIDNGKIQFPIFLKFLKLLESNYSLDRNNPKQKLFISNYYIKLWKPYYGKYDVDKLCHSYLLILSWICQYYFNGISNWRIFYDFHLTPFVSDIIRFLEVAIINPIPSAAVNLNLYHSIQKTEPVLPY